MSGVIFSTDKSVTSLPYLEVLRRQHPCCNSTY